MAVQYQVRAQVVDLRTDRPLATDRFYVDTNVWFWIAYPNIHLANGAPHQQRIDAFSLYCRDVLTVGGSLHWCGLSLAELARGIERTEFEAYKASGAVPAVSHEKEYRHNLHSERERVAKSIATAWQDIEGLAKPLPSAVQVDAAMVKALLAALPKLPLDGYDFFPLKVLHETGITQIMSGDGDFCTVPGITLFTDNKNVITAAREAGKLLAR